MIAVLTLGGPFGAGLAVVCTALLLQRSTPCPRVRRYARLVGGSNVRSFLIDRTQLTQISKPPRHFKDVLK